jgi:molybdopterin/thiamine biosynthesis adenylyltransferase
MADVRDYLKSRAHGDLLPWSAQQAAAETFGLPVAAVEKAALESGLLPARYQRNRKTFSIDDQLKFFRTSVAVVGCGGLGGYIVEELARLGIGRIKAIDPDVFEEHNLNRQLLATVARLGTSKAEAAAARVAEINPAVSVTALKERFSKDNGLRLFDAVHIAVDALDSISARLELADVCRQLAIPLVHGSIAGWYGQVVSQLPGDSTLQTMYGRCADGSGVEKELGNPSYTPALVASLEVAEVAKLIVGRGTPVRQAMLVVNLLDMEFNKFKIGC